MRVIEREKKLIHACTLYTRHFYPLFCFCRNEKKTPKIRALTIFLLSKRKREDVLPLFEYMLKHLCDTHDIWIVSLLLSAIKCYEIEICASAERQKVNSTGNFLFTPFRSSNFLMGMCVTLMKWTETDACACVCVHALNRRDSSKYGNFSFFI